MDLFQNAKVVRFRSHHDKYLLADDDGQGVTQDRNGLVQNAKWMVEILDDKNVLRFKSCYGKYLTASNMPFLLGMTGKKVLQTLPRRLDSSIEWKPVREGVQVRLKTCYGQYLRANGGLPPWRNRVTHDIPHRTSTQDWILWDVDIIEIRSEGFNTTPPPPPSQSPLSMDSHFGSGSPASSSTSTSFRKTESDDSYIASPAKYGGRVIYYIVANEDGEVRGNREVSFHFKGSTVEELKKKLEEQARVTDILVCCRNPLNEQLYPLRLHLPPNNATMHVVLVPSTGKMASTLALPFNPISP